MAADKVRLVDMEQSGRGAVGSRSKQQPASTTFQDSRRFQKTLFIQPDSSVGEGEDRSRGSVLSPLSHHSVIKTVQPFVTVEMNPHGRDGTVANSLSSQESFLASDNGPNSGVQTKHLI